MSAPELVTVTERAVEEIRSIFDREQPSTGVGLRLGVVGGGCSGLSYEMEFSERGTNDSVLDFGGFDVIIGCLQKMHKNCFYIITNITGFR